MLIEAGLHSSLHASCHHQIIYAKCNLDIVYAPPNERDLPLSKGEYWTCNEFDWEKAFSNIDVDKMVYIFNKTIINI